MASRTSTRRNAKQEKPEPARRGNEAAGRQAPARRPLWSGTLRLALVTVPVKLYPAVQSGARIAAHQIHRPSGKRIQYQKVAPGIGPVDTADIVKGFQVERDGYVLLEAEEIEGLKLEAKETLDIVQFVGQGEIAPIWFDKPYYVVADGDVAEEAYRVLRDAMRATGRIGLGQFVMRGRESVGAIKPCGNGLLLETLRFADEVQDAAPYFAAFDDDAAEPELLDLARNLIERKSAPFEPGRFHDQYTEALRALIEAKARRRKPVAVGEEHPHRGGKVIDLVEALKRSVEGGGTPARPQRRRKAAS